jgi:hypothetical protein
MDDATKLGRSITTCMEEVSRYGRSGGFGGAYSFRAFLARCRE